MTTENTVDIEDFDDESDTWEPGKEVRFRVVAEISLGENEIYEGHPVEQAILNEYIKIKSGLYENIAAGYVLSVERIPDNTEETRN